MSRNYIDQSLAFKVRKTLRYTNLYGISRTMTKVRAQYHMQRGNDFEGESWINPNCPTPDHPDRSISIIGCGNFSYSNIAYYLAKARPNFLRSTLDTNTGRARSLCVNYGGYLAATRLDQVASDERVRLVYIASNHASHAEYAIELIRAGKHVHIEKPHVVSEEQLTRLLAAMEKHPQVKVFLGFNRPRSPHFRRLMARLAEQQGPVMINWFIAGHEIPDDHWYFKPEEGGRILGNLCHWTDLTLAIVGRENAFPCEIIPASAPGATSDFSVSILFPDRSVAAITFSAKGHTFDGVREVLNVHKGDALISLRDFHETRVDVNGRRERLITRYRDHGHAANILNSASGIWASGVPGEARDQIIGSAMLYLKVREAIESRRPLQLQLAGAPVISARAPVPAL